MSAHFIGIHLQVGTIAGLPVEYGKPQGRLRQCMDLQECKGAPARLRHMTQSVECSHGRLGPHLRIACIRKHDEMLSHRRVPGFLHNHGQRPRSRLFSHCFPQFIPWIALGSRRHARTERKRAQRQEHQHDHSHENHALHLDALNLYVSFYQPLHRPSFPETNEKSQGRHLRIPAAFPKPSWLPSSVPNPEKPNWTGKCHRKNDGSPAGPPPIRAQAFMASNFPHRQMGNYGTLRTDLSTWKKSFAPLMRLQSQALWQKNH